MDAWESLLTDAIRSSTKQQVADQLGVSRSAISLIANGKYPASVEHIAQKILLVYGAIDCPYLQKKIALSDCRFNYGRAAPVSSPREMKFWRACQSCPHNPMNQNIETQGDKS